MDEHSEQAQKLKAGIIESLGDEICAEIDVKSM